MLKTRPFAIALAILLGTALATHADEAKPVLLLQDFENNPKFEVWPVGANVALATDWASDGKQSVRIAKEAMMALSDLATHDWSAYQVLRFHVRVPGEQGAMIAFELADDAPAHHLNRHHNAVSAPPGDSVVEVDIAGDLWRGEVNKPYRMEKTPLNKKNITRLGIHAQNCDLYVDQFELVKVAPIATPGGFAFDFGRVGAKSGGVQNQWIGVNPTTVWAEDKGYGLTPGATALPLDTPYPTPMMGSGVMLNDARFEVKLPGSGGGGGGKYLGWVVFERSGFWEGDAARYTKAALLANGKVVHSHDSTIDEADFLLQDREILDQAGVVQMVMDRQKAADFTFDAADGRNTFTMQVEGAVGGGRGGASGGPRIAGLVLAPDTDAGRAFIAAHKKLQTETIIKTHRLISKQDRPGDPAKATANLILVPLPTDATMYPKDWPNQTASQPVPPISAMAGLTVGRTLGLYAKVDLAGVRATLTPLTGDAGTIPGAAVQVLSNNYMPVHGYEETACWIETHDYRPVREMTVGPELARTLVILIDVPEDTKPGTYKATLQIDAPAGRAASVAKVEVPITLQVYPGKLPLPEMNVGLFSSGVAIPKAILGDQEYWALGEEVLKNLHRGGFTLLTGGPNYSLRWDGDTPVFSGDEALKWIAMAKPLSLTRCINGYGGLILFQGKGGVVKHPGMSDDQVAAALFKAWEAFRTRNNLPEHYLYCYDEPGTEREFASLAATLKAYTGAGFKTTGYTSLEDPAAADDNHKMLARETYAPSYNEHSAATLKFVRDQGREPWVYNNGLSRTGLGIHLWRNHRNGAAGRIDWIGSIIQGYQYDALDSREPDLSSFYFHSKLGVLLAPRFLGPIEGSFDARLLFELERRAKTPTPGAAGAADKIKALFKEIEARPYVRDSLPWDTLEDLRLQMLKLIEETNG